MDNYNDDWEDGYPVTPKPLNTFGDDMSEFDILLPEASTSETLNALLKFSINNQDLVKLETLLGEFNPFKILGAADFEIRHSNVLGWLLDPNGHHGLGDTLFKNFLLEILKNNRGGELPKIEEVMGCNFVDLQIMREWRNIDILAVSLQNRVVVVIENKINSNESENQLAKYADIVNKKYSDYKKVFVFLTLDGTIPKGRDLYVPFTHGQIHDIVQSVTEIRRDYMHTKVYDFIGQYLKILEEKAMQNEELVAICSKLYREHKDAIRMIMDYGKPKLPPKYMQDFHSRTGTESIFMDKDSVKLYYSFIPRAWSGIVPTTSLYSNKYLVCFGFDFSTYESHKIAMSLYISYFPDQDERRRFVKLIEEAAETNKNIKLNVRRATKASTTLFSKTISLKYEDGADFDLDDYTAVTEKLIKEYTSKEVKEALKTVDSVVQKFWDKNAGK